MNTPLVVPTRRRGFTLIEALIALVIMAFGLLVLAGVNVKLARNEDVAKQRAEATRLAQEKVEEFRSFTQLQASAGAFDWTDLTNGNDSISSSVNYATNTTFTRTWTMLGAAGDPMRRLQVTVSWIDRTGGDPQQVQFSTVISKTDPRDVGALAFPLPGNTNLKLPKNRNINIPVPAIELGNGKSVINLQDNLAVVFSNDTGYIVLTCDHKVEDKDDLAFGCTEAAAYIIAGYVSGPDGFPATLAMNPMQLSGSTGVTCSLANAINQNDGSVIAGYKYYLCVVNVAAIGNQVSGTMRLAAPTLNAGATNYLVCRFEYGEAPGVSANTRNVQPYAGLAESLDNQNYVITTASSCPTVDSLATTQHQNCRSDNPNKNVNRAADCPATASTL